MPRRRPRHVLLLVSSYVFYMALNARLVSIVIALTLFDFTVGVMLDRIQGAHGRKVLLVASLAANLGVLAVFKYADFFILSLRDLLAAAGLHTGWHSLHII